ncbi:hypothetical protein GQ43DRAFT_428247 [Delitschia confertaspora ATCC 74209]|uniref:Ricin B lectin domain-containing protein n=1 Tax=Delitschia confertaspora ATCC 74209 TaxID=1513339 RepID=A0A9P4N2Y1_9PLEO|nr:hypothetical protein GQ43DRAFT_428247 [Delitschia confertaspora ATCC 74209]
MATMNFNPNKWYQWYNNQDETNSMIGTSLYDRGQAGAIFIQATNTTKNGQKWQFFAVDSPASTYIVRCRDGGPQGFLEVFINPSVKEEDVPGQTVPWLAKNGTDNSIYWRFGAWGDGTYYMYNKQNGTDWYLKRRGNGLLAMEKSTTTPQDGLRYNFREIGEIADAKYSTVQASQTTIGLATATGGFVSAITSASAPSNTSAPPNTSTTPTPSSSPSSNASPSSSPDNSSAHSSSGLSTGAKVAIGVTIPVVAILAVLLAFFFIRRRRNRQAPYQDNAVHEMPVEVTKYEMYQSDVKHEMTNTPGVVELPGDVITPPGYPASPLAQALKPEPREETHAPQGERHMEVPYTRTQKFT